MPMIEPGTPATAPAWATIPYLSLSRQHTTSNQTATAPSTTTRSQLGHPGKGLKKSRFPHLPR